MNTPRPVRVYMSVTGCRTNQEEINSFAAKLTASGGDALYLIVDDIKDADIIIVNTCSVTSHAESKTRRLIQSLSRENENAKILVTGCFAQQHGEALLKYDGVKWVVGNGDKHRIAEIINLAYGAYLPDIGTDGNNGTGDTSFWDTDVVSPDKFGRTRFSIKIQEGCDFKCAYCIVPKLRGRSRSAPRQRLIDIFKSAIDKGYKEIVLTGTHIGQYAGGLESLLHDFLKVGGDYRIRLSSLDPRDLTDSLIDLVGAGERVCPHLHVSVQSLSARVLAAMDRPYDDLENLTARLRGFRVRYPHAGLGGDFIVGHPGETDGMFEETRRTVETIGFTYGHVFRFSRRAGTAACVMPCQTGESVKKERSTALRSVLQNGRENFLSLQTPAPERIIIENEFPIRGVSGNYIRVEIPSARAPKNSWMRVALTGKTRGEYCIGAPLAGAQ